MKNIKTNSYIYILTLFWGILISILIGYYSYKTNIEKEQIRFDALTKNIINDIYNRMDTYREVLYSGVGFFKASEHVSRDEWHTFVKTLQIKRYFPGIQGIGYSVVLREDELAQNIETIKANGFSEYQIFPKGKRDLYTSVIYLEPFDKRNQRAFGYDMYSEKMRQKAMSSSIETGLPTLSGKVRLVQENGIDEQTGFLLYSPLYKKNMPLDTIAQRYEAIEGFVYGVFRTKDFLLGTIEDVLKVVDLKIYDGGEQNESMLLYASDENIAKNGLLNSVIKIELDGHSWTFEIDAKESFYDIRYNINSFIFTILSLLITFLIAQIIKRQLEIEILKEEALLNVSQGILVTDNECRVIYSNRAFEELTGYSRESIYGKNPNFLQGVDTDKKCVQTIKAKLKTLEPFECDILNYKKDGTIFWNNLSITPVFDNNQKVKRFIGIQNDITQKKLLEKSILFEKTFIENILNNTNAIIALIDMNGVMVRLNDYGQNFVGYTQDEISSTPYFWEKFIPNNLRDKIKKIVTNANRGILVEKRKNSWISSSGEERIFEWSNRLIRDERGKIQYLITVGIDVTKEVLAQEQYKKYQKQLELSANIAGLLFWELDLQTNQFTFDDMYYRYLATTAKAEGGYNIDVQYFMDTFIPKDEHQIIIDAITEVLSRDSSYSAQLEHSIIRRDGKVLQMITNYFTIYKDGKAIKAYGSNYDLTEQKAKQQELEVAKERADKANRAKSDFLANMSHEIRTPLNGIIGLTNLTLATKLTQTQKNYLTKSITSSNALLHVINDILDYSKIEANKIELERIPFELDKLFHQVSDLFIYEVNKKEIELICSISPILHNNLIGDPFRITQILINLIGNAIKFTNRGFIDISVSLEEIKESSLVLIFTVKDSGIGISKEKQKRLFQEFSQVDTSNTREYGGSGLGLLISQKLANLMGGDIFVQSREGEGSSFSFRATVEYQKRDYKFLSLELKDKRVLIVNQNIKMCDILEEMLNMFGLISIVCSDVKGALNILKSDSFDYMVVDWELSNMDGVEFIELINNKYHKEDIQTIIISECNKKEELIMSAKSHGIDMDRVLITPFSSSTLLDVLVNSSNRQLTPDKSIQRVRAFGKVLVVEDNEINLLVAKQNLENFGLYVDSAINGEIAVEKIKNSSFDLIFMDLQMPIMDGFEATKKIREFNSDIPIIALSAAVMRDDLKMTKEAGMNGHLSKPIDIEKLKQVVIKYLKTSYEKQESNIEIDIEESIEGVDLKELLYRFNNNKAVAYKSLLDFANNKRDIVTQLDSLGLESKEFDVMIHSLKGVSGNLSLKDVFRYSSEIYASDNLDTKEELLVKLKDSLNIVISAINKNISPKEQKSNTQSDISKDKLIEEIKLLNIDISQGAFIDLERRESILGKIEIVLNKNIADELEKYLSNYDYKNAQITLEKIIED